jgi:hypothetical protein
MEMKHLRRRLSWTHSSRKSCNKSGNQTDSQDKYIANVKQFNVFQQGVKVTSALLLLLLTSLFAPDLKAQNGVQPGEFIVEPPTLTNLGFEWYITGDNNRNATVNVEYRSVGSKDWKEAMPLLRIGGEHVGRAREKLDYVTPHMFAGSILDVTPDTEYECRFTMIDTDNKVKEIKTVTVKTRAEPKAFQGGRVLHVYTANWTGPKKEPSFNSLMAAYFGAGLGDWNVVQESPVQPGDIIEVHAGLYEANRLDYVTPHAIPFDGTYFLTLKGTKEKPIVIRAAGDGEVIFDGAGAHTLFDVTATENHIFEGITFRNTDIVFWAGHKHINGAKGLTIKKCRMENVGAGIITEYAGSTNFYIADNVIIGRDDRYRLNGWANAGNGYSRIENIYGSSKMFSYNGIKVYGSGHVVCNNAIAFFHDGICISTYGTPEKEQELKAVSIDILNNDIHLSVDDFIESDGGVHNIRVMRNRGVNAYEHGVSSQPVFGGPVYFIRNVLYNIPSGGGAIKINAKPSGMYVLHNTFIAENSGSETFSNVHMKNNLFLAPDSAGRIIAAFPLATSYSTYDYNGYRPNPKTEKNFLWVAPPAGQLQDYSVNISKNGKAFNSLVSLALETGLEKHGIEIDYDVFENLKAPDAKKPHFVYHAVDLNFKLNPKGKAVDAGVRLSNVNDDFTGKSPDLGALEVGKPEPVYGPRGEVLNRPFYR